MKQVRGLTMYALLQIGLDWGEDELPPMAVLKIGAKRDLEALW